MKSFVGYILFLLIFPSFAFAARPLSTDDAGTVEKGHFEIESGFEYADKTDNEYNWSGVLKYGLLETWDIGIELPYQYIEVAGDDDVDGLSDVIFSSKYRFLEEDKGLPALAFSFSIKSKTGNEDKGLGTGAIDYAINTILTKEINKIITHLNLGYTSVGGPEGTKDDDVFSYALALEYPFNDRINLVGELTGETNFDGDFDANPFAGRVGFNYALTEIATLDLGFGWGVSKASPDYLIITGLTLSF